MARSMRRRGFTRDEAPAFVSVTGTPVDFSSDSIWSTVDVLALLRNRAKAPATCGAAMDVPDLLAKPPPGTDDRMLTPGASRSSWSELFELAATASLSSTEPTLIA